MMMMMCDGFTEHFPHNASMGWEQIKSKQEKPRVIDAPFGPIAKK